MTIIMSTIKMYSRMIHVDTRLRNQSMDASYFRNNVNMRVTVAIFRENPPSICFVVKVYLTCIICLFVCLFVWGLTSHSRIYTHTETSPLPVKSCKF